MSARAPGVQLPACVYLEAVGVQYPSERWDGYGQSCAAVYSMFQRLQRYTGLGEGRLAYPESDRAPGLLLRPTRLACCRSVAATKPSQASRRCVTHSSYAPVQAAAQHRDSCITGTSKLKEKLKQVNGQMSQLCMVDMWQLLRACVDMRGHLITRPVPHQVLDQQGLHPWVRGHTTTKPASFFLMLSSTRSCDIWATRTLAPTDPEQQTPDTLFVLLTAQSCGNLWLTHKHGCAPLVVRGSSH